MTTPAALSFRAFDARVHFRPREGSGPFWCCDGSPPAQRRGGFESGAWRLPSPCVLNLGSAHQYGKRCILDKRRANISPSPLPTARGPMADAHSKPVWLITGCSTGFGRELSLILLKRGYRVVATARDKSKVDDIVAGNPKNGLALALDVDKQGQIDAAVKAAEARFGRIDVLVNNAGYGYLAAVEEGDDADVRAMFETNFFGLAAMTRAVLPIMRAQKSGAIVNVSSMGGFIGFPGSGYYAATKFAVEGLSESLSKEVGPLGIKVIIVEPGPFRTHWAGRSPEADPELQRKSAGRSCPRVRSDHYGGRTGPSAAPAAAWRIRLRIDG